jgi:hypothetical protein
MCIVFFFLIILYYFNTNNIKINDIYINLKKKKKIKIKKDFFKGYYVFR